MSVSVNDHCAVDGPPLALARMHALDRSLLLPRVLAAFALRCALATLASGATRELVAQAIPSERQVVREVEMKGVSQVDGKALIAAVATKETECRNPLYTPVCWFSTSSSVMRERYLDSDELRRDVLR